MKGARPPLVMFPLRFEGGPLDGERGTAKGIPGAHFPPTIRGPGGVVYHFHLRHGRIVYTLQGGPP